MSNVADFEDLMNKMYQNAEKFAVPDLKTKVAMTDAGAKVLADELYKNTPRTDRKEVKYGHLQDNVTYMPTDIDGEVNGNSVVGFGRKAYIARFLNDGTVKMKANHFVDQTIKKSGKAVFDAQRKVLEHRGGE